MRAGDILRTIRQSLRVPAWNRYLGVLSEVLSTTSSLTLRLTEPASFLPALLATSDFAPTPPDPSLGSGAYYPAGLVAPDNYLLAPARADAVPLRVRVNRDVDQVPERFAAEEVDVTCSTAFPLPRLPEFRHDRAYRTAHTGIQVRLEPVPGAEAPVDLAPVRRAILAAVDRAAISDALRGGVRPSLPWQPRDGGQDDWLPRRLVIGYHDYPPNPEIADLVAAQLGAFGVRTETIALDFASGDATGADLLLALRCAPFDHPYAHWEHYDLARAHPGLRSYLADIRAGVATGKTMNAMKAALAEIAPMIPLVELDGHWLRRSTMAEFSWPRADRCLFPIIRRTRA